MEKNMLSLIFAVLMTPDSIEFRAQSSDKEIAYLSSRLQREIEKGPRPIKEQGLELLFRHMLTERRAELKKRNH